MTRHVLMLLGVLAAGGAAATAWSDQVPREARGFRAGPARLREALGLTDAQVEQIRKARMEQRKATIRRRADLQIARAELHELLQAPMDERTVAAKVKELSDLQAAALRARVDGAMAFRKLLTPEQQQKLRGMGPLHRRGPRFHRRFGGGRMLDGSLEDRPELDEAPAREER